MITDSARFFGRHAQLTAAFNRLASATPQCASILGEHRLGRSSLLWHIKTVFPQWLPQPHLYRFGYVDLAHARCRTPDGLRAHMIHALFEDRHERLTVAQFDDLLFHNNREGILKPVLLLDEFEALLRHPDRFDDDFFDGLRAYANAGQLTYVTASRLSLPEIAGRHAFGSTFFGLFEEIPLGLFNADEARESILRPGEQPLDESDFERIAGWTGGEYHPLKLNIAADLIWQARRRGAAIDDARLAREYAEKTDYALGQQAHRMHARQHRRDSARAWGVWLKDAVNYLTGDKPWVLLVVALILALLAWGLIAPEQLLELVRGAFGITASPSSTPALTPTPGLTPTLLP